MATTLYLKQQFNSAAGVSGGLGTYQYASLTRSVLAFISALTSTTAAGSNIQMTQTAGGTLVAWISPPLFSPITISGTITLNLWAKMNLLSANTTVAVSIIKYTGGAEGATVLNASSFGTAVGTTITHCNWTGSPTSTSFGAGDRIVIKCLITHATSLVMVAGDTCTMDYAGLTSAADGDAFVTFTEAIFFALEPEFIQTTGNGTASGTFQTLAITFPGKTAAGNLLIVVATVVGTPTVIDTLTVSDSPGADSFTGLSVNPMAWAGGGTNLESDYFWYAGNVIGGAIQTITVTKSASDTQFLFGAIYEYGGMAASPFDVTASAAKTGTGTAMSSNASPTVNFANELIVGYENDGGSLFTPASNFVSRVPGSEGLILEDMSVQNAALTSYTATGTLSPSDPWVMTVVAFKWATQPFFPMGWLQPFSLPQDRNEIESY
jgi:hypothetical protein